MTVGNVNGLLTGTDKAVDLLLSGGYVVVKKLKVKSRDGGWAIHGAHVIGGPLLEPIPTPLLLPLPRLRDWNQTS